MSSLKQLVTRSLPPLAAVALAAAIVGCSGGKLDTEGLGNAVGGTWGSGIKAVGHEANALTMSEKDEAGIGQSVGVSAIATYRLLHDDELTKYVTFVAFTLVSTSPRPDLHPYVGILDTPEVNAFSGPNGYIFITRGALAMMQNEAELAGVLGHEITHVNNHDGLKQIKSAEQNAALSDAVKASPAASFDAVADLGVDAITKVGYSQPQEFAADKGGVILMIAAGYNPNSYLNFLQRIAAKQASGGGVMSTHPDASSRVTKVQAQIATLPAGGAVLADRFKANVHLY
jgi:predicted Zn-dependent protease